MSKFVMMSRPKKPSQYECLQQELWNGISIPDFTKGVEAFISKHLHLTLADVSVDFDYSDEGYGQGVILQAAGKPHAVYLAEMKAYKKALKLYNNWRADNREAILKHKESEKKRIAKNKLERSKKRLTEELAGVEAKLEKA